MLFEFSGLAPVATLPALTREEMRAVAAFLFAETRLISSHVLRAAGGPLGPTVMAGPR